MSCRPLAGDASAECATTAGSCAGVGGSTEYEATTVPSKQLRLMTIRSEGQFNTVVYEDEDFTAAQTAAT